MLSAVASPRDQVLYDWLHDGPLTPVELDVVKRLTRALGEWVSAEVLLRAIWPGVEHDMGLANSDRHNLRVHLSRIRRKLPHGWIIENHYYHAEYRLIQDDLTPARRVLLEYVTERQFRSQVLQWAQECGWQAYFTWRSDHSPSGFPDLVLVRPPRVIFAELKAQNGVLSAHQRQWLTTLEACPGIEVYVWRPVDEARVLEILTGHVNSEREQ